MVSRFVNVPWFGLACCLFTIQPRQHKQTLEEGLPPQGPAALDGAVLHGGIFWLSLFNRCVPRGDASPDGRGPFLHMSLLSVTLARGSHPPGSEMCNGAFLALGCFSKQFQGSFCEELGPFSQFFFSSLYFHHCGLNPCFWVEHRRYLSSCSSCSSRGHCAILQAGSCLLRCASLPWWTSLHFWVQCSRGSSCVFYTLVLKSTASVFKEPWLLWFENCIYKQDLSTVYAPSQQSQEWMLLCQPLHSCQCS